MDRVTRRDQGKVIKALLEELLSEDCSLQEPVAKVVHAAAVRAMGRECLGDDDAEHYALEDKIVERAVSFIERAVHSELSRLHYD